MEPMDQHRPQGSDADSNDDDDYFEDWLCRKSCVF